MGDDLDVDALLEEPYLTKDTKTRTGRKDEISHSHRRSGRSRSRSREKRQRSRSKERRDRSRDRSRRSDRRSSRRSRSRDRRDRRRSSRDRGGGGGGSGGGGGGGSGGGGGGGSGGGGGGGSGGGGNGGASSGGGRQRRGSPPPRRSSRERGRQHGRVAKSRSPPEPLLTPEERDSRTVCIMQLSQRVRARDVEEFFSSVGKIRDVKLIVCNKTKRFKGICYVEFRDLEAVSLALGLSGRKLLGVPVIVQPSQAEKNRVGNYEPPRGVKEKGPTRLYVGSLHFNITQEMLRGIFEPFGPITAIQLIMDPETGRSKGYGFVTYADNDDAKKALEQLNGFELAGRPMKVGHVSERTEAPIGPSYIDADQLDRSGVDLGTTGRLALMAKLAEGTGMKLPQAASQALHTAAAAAIVKSGGGSSKHQQMSMQHFHARQQPPPPIATQCFMLSNMFNPAQETNPGWDREVRDDVIDECNKSGGVLHLQVDTASPTGNVYVKCPDVATAVAAVNALHGRWFAGKVITAAYVPVINYHNLFPDAITAVTLLQTNR